MKGQEFSYTSTEALNQYSYFVKPLHSSLIKLNSCSAYDQHIWLLGILSDRNSYVSSLKDMYNYIHNTTIHNWKELKYLFIIRIRELWHYYVHALGYYTTVRLNELYLLSSDSRNKVHKHNADWWKPDVILVKVQKQAKQISSVRSRAMNTREASAAWKETGSLKDTGYMCYDLVSGYTAVFSSWKFIELNTYVHVPAHILYFNKVFFKNSL